MVPGASGSGGPRRGSPPEGERRPAFRIDLHVHTGRYSQCAELVDPLAIPAAAERAGLQGVVLTDHDILWTEEEIAILQAASPRVRIFAGIECSLRGAHAVIVGIDDAGGIERGATLGEIAERVGRPGVAIVLAHPFRGTVDEDLPWELVDAVEVASTSFSPDDVKHAKRLARRLKKPAVAGSDAHTLSHIGRYWTEFPTAPRDERELAELIRQGLGTPGAARGRAHRSPHAKLNTKTRVRPPSR